MSLKEKTEHVRAAKQTWSHECHWPGCKTQVPPARWGCATHWYRLPPRLRARVWEAYVPGQEETMTPSATYLEVADEVDAWIKANFK